MMYFQTESTDDGGVRAQALYDYQAGKMFLTVNSPCNHASLPCKHRLSWSELHEKD